MVVQKSIVDSQAGIPLQQFDQSTLPWVTLGNDEDEERTQQSHHNARCLPREQLYTHHKQSNSKSIPQRKVYHHDRWTWEFIGIVTSGFSLASMVAVLLYFDGKRPPDHTTINTILSWTATIAKSAMLIPVTECISQSKWIWFSERDRDLADLEYFDEGSRGPWGSLRLLIRLRARHLGVLGAIVTLVALAFDPVVQVITRQDIRVIEVDKIADVAASEFYGTADTISMASFESAPLPMKGAIYNGLFTDNPMIRPNFRCSTGNCTWSDYLSLAVCSNCKNVTSMLQINCTTSCDAGLPGGAALLGSKGSVMSTHASADPVFFKNISRKAHVLGVFQNIAAFGQRRAIDISSIEAAECILYLCVHSYKSTLDMGNLNEAILKTWPDLNSTLEKTPMESTADENFYTVLGKKYGMANTTFNEISKHLRTLLNGTASYENARMTFSTDAFQPIWDNDSFDDPIHRIAATMTKIIRDGNSTDSNWANGRVWEWESYITVRWWWLTLPVFLFTVTTVQLVLTILKTRRSGAGLWRSSTLAILFHGLDRDTYDTAADRSKRVQAAGGDGENFLKIAKDIKVVMAPGEDGIMKLSKSNE